MRLPAKLHYAWVVAAVTFVVLLLTAGVRAASGILMAGVLRVSFGTYLETFLFAGLLCFAAAAMALSISAGDRRPELAPDAVPAA